MANLEHLYAAIVSGDDTAARDITQQALAEYVDALTLIDQYMSPAMTEVGRRFEACEYFVSELLLRARAMSALLTTTMLATRRAIEARDQAGLCDRVKILVGGAPVTPQLAAEIGADGSRENAVEAVVAARKVLGQAAA